MNNQNPIDGQLTIIDSEGNEKLCQILFTLESEEFGKKYVVFYEVSELAPLWIILLRVVCWKKMKFH